MSCMIFGEPCSNPVICISNPTSCRTQRCLFYFTPSVQRLKCLCELSTDLHPSHFTTGVPVNVNTGRHRDPLRGNCSNTRIPEVPQEHDSDSINEPTCRFQASSSSGTCRAGRCPGRPSCRRRRACAPRPT